jgi:hypothetical protein
MTQSNGAIFKRIIWSSDINIEDWKDYRETLEAEGECLDDEQFFNEVIRLNDEYLDDERVNLDKELGNVIICIADLGLWNGRRSAYKLLGKNISDCLYSDTDSNTWYIDGNGDFCCRAVHHDGVNYYRYRVFRDGITEAQIDNFCDKIFCGTVTPKDVSRYTRRIGPEIAKIYGFDCPGRKTK